MPNPIPGVDGFQFYLNFIQSPGTTGAKIDPAVSDALKKIPKGSEYDQQRVNVIVNSNWYKTEYPGMQYYIQSHPGGTATSYKALEQTYIQTAKYYGLPAGFYDNPAKIATLMKNNINPNAFEENVKNAMDLATKQDPATLKALKEIHPELATPGAIASYFLDPKESQVALTNLVQQAQIKGRAEKAGLGISNEYALSLVQSSEPGDYLRKAAIKTATEQAGVIAPGAQDLATAAGQTLTADQILEGTLSPGSAAGKQLTGLASQERAKFLGSSAGTSALDKNIAGSF